MLRFSVHEDDSLTGEDPLLGAYLIGADDLAEVGKVAIKRGEIHCSRKGNRSTALCLQYDAGRMGLLMLQTCLLPDRHEPYVLAVELARHRIKFFITKSEEWQMFELSAEHPAMKLWEQARRRFTRALTAATPNEGAKAARQALIDAIEATELLAMAHAEILLHRRYAQRPASSTALAVRVWPTTNASAQLDTAAKEFDVIVLPMRWSELEKEEGSYDWSGLDRTMQWAASLGKPIIAGPLIDFSKDAVPNWLYVWQNDYDTCRDLVYDHVERLVKRYAEYVSIWNLSSGLNTNENFKLKFEQMIDLTRMAALRVKQERKNARVMIEVAQPFAEHCAFNPDSIAPVTFVDRVVQEGVRLNCIGIKVLLGRREQGMSTRDLMQISNMLDRYFLLDVPVLLTAIGVPSEEVDPRGGRWMEAFSDSLQSRWATRMFAIAMSKPYVETVTWSDLFDHENAELPEAGLIDVKGKPKSTLQRLVSVRRRLRKPLGALRLPGIVGASDVPGIPGAKDAPATHGS
jgi:hypothetical protein